MHKYTTELKVPVPNANDQNLFYEMFLLNYEISEKLILWLNIAGPT